MSDLPTTPPAKRLVRSRDRRMVAGVCAGLADYSGIDVTIIRLVVVVGSILGFGSLIVAYLVAWVLIPQEP
jgi:phage shock protein PspC (stress-responsive transcriptional regulator)